MHCVLNLAGNRIYSATFDDVRTPQCGCARQALCGIFRNLWCYSGLLCKPPWVWLGYLLPLPSSIADV